MSRRGRIEAGGRPIPVTWLDPVAASPIEVAAGGVLVTALGLIGLIWGAAVSSSWVINGEAAPIGVGDAGVAMVRFGANGLSWEGAWPEGVDQALAGPGWFWLFFGLEAIIVALLFWPAWRLFGPRPADPAPVVVEERKPKHPRNERRKEERERRSRAQTRMRAAAGAAGVVPIAASGAAVGKALVTEPTADRIVLGRAGKRLVAADQLHSVLVFGPTRSGKTASLTVPAVLDWAGPVLVVAAKTDVVSLTWRARSRLGGRAWLFDPTSAMAGSGPDPEAAGGSSTPRRTTHGWSPLGVIEAVPRVRSQPELDRREMQWSLARRMAQTMIDAGNLDAHGSAPSPPAVVAARSLLAPLLLAAVAEEVSVGQVVEWVERRDRAGVELALDRAEVAEARSAWEGAHRLGPATETGYAVLALVLSPYADPAVLAQARTPEISADRLVDGDANTLYVLAPPHRQARLGPVLTALVAEVLDAAMAAATASMAGRLRAPLLVVFDDAIGCAPAGSLEQLASVGAGLGIQVMTLVQDLGSLEGRFGPAGALRLANDHRAKLVLGGVGDGATLRYVNSLITGHRLLGPGSASVDPDVGAGGGGVEPIVASAPAWIRTIGDDQALYVHGNLPPLRMALRPWYDDPALRAKVEPPAPRRRSWFRREASPLIGGGFPNPLNSDGNDAEAARYWNQVRKDGRLPEARVYEDGS